MKKTDLGLDDFCVIDAAETENSITVRIEQENEFRACTECGSVRCISTGKKKRHFRDIEFNGKFCGIEIVATRYKCQDCGATCYPQTDILQEGFRMTKRLYNQICEECFRMPFTNVANMHGLEETLVRRAFRQYADKLDEGWIVKAPRVLGIDECHLAKEARAVFVEMDKKNGNRLLQMARDRKKDTVIDILSNMVQEQDKIYPEIVTMDFSNGYRNAVEEVFGAATKVVIDHFHVQKLAMEATSEAYKLIRAEMLEAVDKMEADEARAFKSKWNKAKVSVKLIRLNKEDLTDEQKNRLALAFKLWPDFATLFACKESFREVFNKNQNREDAERDYADWTKRIPKTEAFKPFRKMKATITRWHTEVFNFFDCERYSNGPVEALNGVIKNLNRMGRGYSYEVIRAKALHRTTVTSKPKYKRVRFEEEKWVHKGSSTQNTSYSFVQPFGTGLVKEKVWSYKTVLTEGCGNSMDAVLAALEEMVPTLEGYPPPEDPEF